MLRNPIYLVTVLKRQRWAYKSCRLGSIENEVRFWPNSLYSSMSPVFQFVRHKRRDTLPVPH